MRYECKKNDIISATKMSKGLGYVRLMAVEDEQAILCFLSFGIMLFEMTNPVQLNVIDCVTQICGTNSIVVVQACLCKLAFLMQLSAESNHGGNNNTASTDIFNDGH